MNQQHGQHQQHGHQHQPSVDTRLESLSPESSPTYHSNDEIIQFLLEGESEIDVSLGNLDGSISNLTDSSVMVSSQYIQHSKGKNTPYDSTPMQNVTYQINQKEECLQQKDREQHQQHLSHGHEYDSQSLSYPTNNHHSTYAGEPSLQQHPTQQSCEEVGSKVELEQQCIQQSLSYPRYYQRKSAHQDYHQALSSSLPQNLINRSEEVRISASGGLSQLPMPSGLPLRSQFASSSSSSPPPPPLPPPSRQEPPKIIENENENEDELDEALFQMLSTMFHQLPTTLSSSTNTSSMTSTPPSSANVPTLSTTTSTCTKNINSSYYPPLSPSNQSQYCTTGQRVEALLTQRTLSNSLMNNNSNQDFSLKKVCNGIKNQTDPSLNTTPIHHTTRNSKTTNDKTKSPTSRKLASSSGSRIKKSVRRKCSVLKCTNGVVQGGLCIAHGARRKICQHPGCTKRVKQAGMCSSHGSTRKRCNVEGCTKFVEQGGKKLKCVVHGAKFKNTNVCGNDMEGLCEKQASASASTSTYTISSGKCETYDGREKSKKENPSAQYDLPTLYCVPVNGNSPTNTTQQDTELPDMGNNRRR